MLRRRLPGVERDVNNLISFWTKHQGAATDAGRTINDAYLKINGIKGGVRSYRRSAQLLVVYARRFGGIVPKPKI